MDRTSTRQLTIDEEYAATYPRSQELYRRACDAITRGVTNDGRLLTPFPIYGVRGQAARKWDADGHEYIDYAVGHGALMLGHGHPDLLAALMDQAVKGTHLGLSHEIEVHWAELIKQIIACAERVEFTSSGNEATSLALRLARAYTNHTRFIKLHGHYHGWHDYVTTGMSEPFEVPVMTGVPREVAETALIAPNNDIAAVERLIDLGDVAAIIMEPTGAHQGQVPTDVEYLHKLREVTARRNVVLIFDEVVTGFRVAPGGAQQFYGITPDLTTLAKIVAGGLPGGAVCGKAEIMAMLDYKPADPQWNRFQRSGHMGTFNSNPLSAAVGIAMLKHIAQGTVHKHAIAMGDRLRDGMQKVIRDRGVKGHVFGGQTIVHIHMGYSPEDWQALPLAARVAPKAKMPAGLFQRAMYLNGIDVFSWGKRMLLCGAHTQDDVDQTIDALDRAIVRLKEEGAL